MKDSQRLADLIEANVYTNRVMGVQAPQILRPSQRRWVRERFGKRITWHVWDRAWKLYRETETRRELAERMGRYDGSNIDR